MTMTEEEPVTHIQEILKPLHQEGGSLAYLPQFREMVEMDRKLRKLESCFNALLSRISALENLLAENNKR